MEIPKVKRFHQSSLTFMILFSCNLFASIPAKICEETDDRAIQTLAHPLERTIDSEEQYQCIEAGMRRRSC